jgi:uncharacterized membrane protein YbhN (UPF0104 family)
MSNKTFALVLIAAILIVAVAVMMHTPAGIGIMRSLHRRH